MSDHVKPDLIGRTHSSRFIQALRNDSNLAMDWLYVATQLSDETERDYCLKRAHYIDPESVALHASKPGHKNHAVLDGQLATNF